MTLCPVCQTPLQGPHRYCAECHVSRPDPVDDRSANAARGSVDQAMQGALSVPPLLLCLAMDAVGLATFFIPVLGEITDVVWGPLSGLVFYLLFRRTPGVNGTLGAMLATTEEMLPFTDIIPTFTIAWFIAKRAARRRD